MKIFKILPLSIFVCAIISLIVLSAGSVEFRNVVVNSSFEDGTSEDGLRPAYWQIGFPDEAPIDSLGEWHLDSTISADGEISLHIIPHCSDVESYFITQFLDAPTFDLEGKTVHFSIKIRTPGIEGGATALLIAYNPESSDSFMGVPVVGYSAVAPEPADTGFVELCDSFVATGPAAVMAVMLIVEGYCDGAWFDDVNVSFDVAEPGEGPDTSTVPDPLDGGVRNFYLGVVGEIARNYSEPAFEDLPEEIAQVGDIVNIFAHIKWNALTGRPILEGHEIQLEISSRAEEIGIARMLTFDFTHNSAETAGEINPLPDGTPVDSLSPEVRDAYIEELLALVEEIDPVIVSVGIEATLLYDRRPDQWDNYILLLQEVNDALSYRPEIHITSYAVLSQIVNYDGTFNEEFRSAWEEILPYCQSVAYSFYSPVNDTTMLPNDYFIKLKELAPDKPILIPEFGCRSDTAQGFSEQIQYDFAKKIISSVAATDPPPVAIIWYQMFDNQYLGTPEWFKTSFATIGLRDYAGTPKMTYIAFRKMKNDAGLKGEKILPAAPMKISASPNPFNNSCSIIVDVPENLPDGENPRMEIYDVVGRTVKKIRLHGGKNRIIWNADGERSGIYFACVNWNGEMYVRRIFLIK